jgi:hypothetical protein
MFDTILFTINLTPSSYPHWLYLPQYFIILYYKNNKLSHCLFTLDYLREYPEILKDTVIQEFKTYYMMYLRWYNLYLYFKYNQNNIPLDLFINIIKYYIDIKPL